MPIVIVLEMFISEEQMQGVPPCSVSTINFEGRNKGGIPGHLMDPPMHIDITETLKLASLVSVLCRVKRSKTALPYIKILFVSH